MNVCSGGYTWAELWYLADRQPEIHEFTAECAQGLTSSPTVGSMYWAHPVSAIPCSDNCQAAKQSVSLHYSSKTIPTAKHPVSAFDSWHLRPTTAICYSLACVLSWVVLVDRTQGGGVDGHDRSNGTLQRSSDGGGEWEFVAHIGDAKMGYGYSDAHVLHDGSVAVAFQKTFDPPAPGVEGGGYDIGLAVIKTHG